MAAAIASLTGSTDGTGTGTLSVTGADHTGPGLGGGSLSVDGGAFVAWTSRERKTGARILINDETITTLGDGTITIRESLADPVKTTEIGITDPRVSRWNPNSLADGDKDLAIRFYVGPPFDIRSWDAFTGRTVGPSDEGVYLPRGKFPARSYAGDWINLPGCKRTFGFSGLTRGKILYDYLVSAGIPADPAIQQLGTIVARPQEINGEPPLDVIRRFGEIEGWWPRVSDDGATLSIISDRYVFGGEPVHAFTEANTFSIVAESPQNVTTRFLLTGTRMTDEALGEAIQVTTESTPVDVTDVDGNRTMTKMIVTSERGVPIRVEKQFWETFRLDGVIVFPLAFGLRRKTVDETVYARAAPLPSETIGRLTTQVISTTTRQWDTTGIPWPVGGGYTWTNGAHMQASVAEFMLVSESTTTYQYDVDDVGSGHVGTCLLTKSVATTKEIYGELLPQAGFGDKYADGKYRAGYTFQVTHIITTSWTDDRSGSSSPSVTSTTDHVHFTIDAVDNSTPPQEHESLILGETTLETWTGNQSDTHYVHSKSTHHYGIASGTDTTPPDEVDGPVPGPANGSANVPQFQQQTFAVLVPFTTNYQDKLISEDIAAAETVDELHFVALRRFVLATCSIVKIRHPLIQFLRPGDPVTVTNAVRGLSAKRGFIDEIESTVDLATGAARQQLVVMILPDWPQPAYSVAFG